MNKAFTKEDESAAPDTIPPRAPLPAGAINYVTARGLQKLKDELETLDSERSHLEAPVIGADNARLSIRQAARRAALVERIATAVLVEGAPRDEIRFGASVTVRNEMDETRTFRIVGVDEADPAQGFVAFVAPLARAVLGRKSGDSVVVKTPRGDEELEIVDIHYGDPG